jgi:hypothetical protein
MSRSVALTACTPSHTAFRAQCSVHTDSAALRVTQISLTRYLSALLQRVLLVFARFGPYALMVFVMMEDVLTFIAVLVVVPFAFAAAAFNL